MKKTVKKLSLSRETVRLLESELTQEVKGGSASCNSCWSYCYCTNYSACCGGGGTQECW